MADENGTGNNFIWAVALIIIVAIIAGALYFTVLKTDNKGGSDTEIKINVPSR